jgi:hypothetical protein
MTLYYNSLGQLVQSTPVMPDYAQPQQPQGMYSNHPNQQAMLDPRQTQTGMVSYNHHNDNSPYPSGPRRSPRLHNHPEATPPYRKRKSTTRKVIEGVLIGVAGIAVLSEVEKHSRKPRRPKAIGDADGLGMNDVMEGGLAAGAVALALYEKNRKRQGSGSGSPHKGGLEDPRLKTLVEGALATAAAVALAYHENSKKSKD